MIRTRRRCTRICVSPIGLALGLLLLLGAIGCAGPSSILRPALRVGVSPTYAPVIFEIEGEIQGIEAELAQLAGDALGRRIVFERYEFPQLLDALERKEIDVVMSGLSITAERAERVLFTEPYMRVGQLAIIRADDVGRLGRIQQIRRQGVRVGYERGTTGERFVAEELPRATSFAFDDVETGIRSLRAERIDYFIHDAPTVWLIAGDPSERDLLGLYKPLTEEHLAWAVHPDDRALKDRLDTLVLHWKREGRIEPILDRWMPVRVIIP